MRFVALVGTHFNSRPSARGDANTLHCWMHCKFQFTPLREGRPHHIASATERQEISIHAPPRGATGWRVRQCWTPTNFNSRPSARGDRRGANRHRGTGNFNSRPSARGDAIWRASTRRTTYFNSRPSARGDMPGGYTPGRPFIFQFTPLREGRRNVASGIRGQAAFQFTPLREGRQQPSITHSAWTANFNSRPSARGDRRAVPVAPSADIFQFTPLREGRLPRQCTVQRRTSYFNSRPSARGDGKRYAISANLLFNPYKSAWLNNRATQFVEIILVIFHRIIA